MSPANPRNLLWSMLVIGTGLAMLLVAVDVLPENVSDLMQRSWPILLVLVGLNMLLIDRVRFGNWLALGLSVPILAAIIYFAYDLQSQKQRTDYVETLDPIPLSENIKGVYVKVETLAAIVVFRTTDDGARAVGAHFVGSSESRLSIAAQENEEGILNFRVTETRPNRIPKLDAVGSGELQVFLPVGVTVSNLAFTNQRGLVTLDFRALDVPRFTIDNGADDVDLYLPRNGVAIGNIRIGDGNLRIVVDPSASLRVEGAPSDTRLNQNDYSLLANGIIESRGGLREFQFNLRLDLPNGSLTIQPE